MIKYLLSLLKKKEEKPKYLIEKKVEYRGYTIQLWVENSDNKYGYLIKSDARIYVDTGWRILELSGAGYYHFRINPTSLKECFSNFITQAKKYIDDWLERPVIIEEIKHMQL